MKKSGKKGKKNNKTFPSGGKLREIIVGKSRGRDEKRGEKGSSAPTSKAGQLGSSGPM